MPERIPHPDDPDGLGPCAKPCRHWDCKEAKENAEKPCIRCGQPLGFGTEYVGADDDVRHVKCPEQA